MHNGVLTQIYGDVKGEIKCFFVISSDRVLCSLFVSLD